MNVAERSEPASLLRLCCMPLLCFVPKDVHLVTISLFKTTRNLIIPIQRHVDFSVEGPVGIFLEREDACDAERCVAADLGMQSHDDVGVVHLIQQVAEADLRAERYNICVLQCACVVQFG